MIYGVGLKVGWVPLTTARIWGVFSMGSPNAGFSQSPVATSPYSPNHQLSSFKSTCLWASSASAVLALAPLSVCRVLNAVHNVWTQKRKRTIFQCEGTDAGDPCRGSSLCIQCTQHVRWLTVCSREKGTRWFRYPDYIVSHMSRWRWSCTAWILLFRSDC